MPHSPRIARNTWADLRKGPILRTFRTALNSGKRQTAYRHIGGCECKVRNGRGCDSYCIYSVLWNRVRQLLYLEWGVECCAKAESVQWGVEWGAKATVYSVRIGIGCDSFECTVRSGMGCDSYCIYSDQWNMVRQLWVYIEEWNGLRELLYLQCGVE